MSSVVRRPYARARRLARAMLWECGIDAPSKIDPIILVKRKQIEVAFGRLDGASGRIFRDHDRAFIRVSDQIVQDGRVRFTIAHEVGHFLLRHRLPQGQAGSENLVPFDTHQEREADIFATEFLMPEEWVAPFCGARISFDGVHDVATTFRTSPVASAVRYAEVSPTSCAVVYSEKAHVKWAKRSRSFPHRIPPKLRIGPGAVAFDYDGRNALKPSPREVPASAWFAPHVAAGIHRLVEHAEHVPEPGWGGVLSLLASDSTSDSFTETPSFGDDASVGTATK